MVSLKNPRVYKFTLLLSGNNSLRAFEVKTLI